MDHTQERIAQWEKMTREAPDDMAYFSLGNAYRDAGRLQDADQALARALELNPQMSRAYQLRAQVLIQLQQEAQAAAVLQAGYVVAAKRGDVMPQRAMESLLHKLNQPIPPVPAADSAPSVDGNAGQAAGENAIIDRKTGQPGTRLPDPPMRGPLGQFILAHYSQETWRLWLRQGTKVINELRLDFSNAGHQRLYDQHMMEWLGISEEDLAQFKAASK